MNVAARGLALIGAVALLLMAGTILSVARNIYLEGARWAPGAGDGLDETVALTGAGGLLLAFAGGLALFGVIFATTGPRSSLVLLVIPGISSVCLSLVAAILILVLHPSGERIALLITPLLMGPSALVLLSGLLLRGGPGGNQGKTGTDSVAGSKGLSQDRKEA